MKRNKKRYKKTVEAFKIEKGAETPDWLNGNLGYDERFDYYYLKGTDERGNKKRSLINVGDYAVLEDGGIKAVSEDEFERKYEEE